MKKVNPVRRLFRMHPLAMIFWIAVIFVIFGSTFEILSMLIWIGVVVLVIYLAYFCIWLYLELN